MRNTLVAVVALCALFSHERANAVPSFARQTGLSCNVCHRNPPELTPFGRHFKLMGYGLGSLPAAEKVGDTNDLLLSKYALLSAMMLITDTAYQKNQPSSQNNAAGFPQQLSIFFAGSFAPHLGGLAQVTYTHSDDHFSMDNTDLRFAGHGTLAGRKLDYGITLNNNPTIEDLWNSTPAWGFPWVSSGASISPIGAPVINGALGGDVAGLGGYSMWNNHLYTAITAYRSEHAGASAPVTGSGEQFNISGAAPYWRAAWQQNWEHNYLMIGTYGLYMSSTPNAITGPKDRYVDSAFDFQFSHPFGANLLDAHGSYIHEKSNLGATNAAGNAAIAAHSLNMYKFDSVYHLRNRYSAAGAIFSTGGTADSLLYAPAPLTGSEDESPNSSGYIAQFAYWPVQNIGLHVDYTGYWKFNGAINNYDGSKRNASDNNTVYMALWLSF
jgi:hypothetical protein